MSPFIARFWLHGLLSNPQLPLDFVQAGPSDPDCSGKPVPGQPPLSHCRGLPQRGPYIVMFCFYVLMAARSSARARRFREAVAVVFEAPPGGEDGLRDGPTADARPVDDATLPPVDAPDVPATCRDGGGCAGRARGCAASRRPRRPVRRQCLWDRWPARGSAVRRGCCRGADRRAARQARRTEARSSAKSVSASSTRRTREGTDAASEMRRAVAASPCAQSRTCGKSCSGGDRTPQALHDSGRDRGRLRIVRLHRRASSAPCRAADAPAAGQPCSGSASSRRTLCLPSYRRRASISVRSSLWGRPILRTASVPSSRRAGAT